MPLPWFQDNTRSTYYPETMVMALFLFMHQLPIRLVLILNPNQMNEDAVPEGATPQPPHFYVFDNREKNLRVTMFKIKEESWWQSYCNDKLTAFIVYSNKHYKIAEFIGQQYQFPDSEETAVEDVYVNVQDDDDNETENTNLAMNLQDALDAEVSVQNLKPPRKRRRKDKQVELTDVAAAKDSSIPSTKDSDDEVYTSRSSAPDVVAALVQMTDKEFRDYIKEKEGSILTKEESTEVWKRCDKRMVMESEEEEREALLTQTNNVWNRENLPGVLPHLSSERGESAASSILSTNAMAGESQTQESTDETDASADIAAESQASADNAAEPQREAGQRVEESHDSAAESQVSADNAAEPQGEAVQSATKESTDIADVSQDPVESDNAAEPQPQHEAVQQVEESATKESTDIADVSADTAATSSQDPVDDATAEPQHEAVQRVKKSPSAKKPIADMSLDKFSNYIGQMTSRMTDKELNNYVSQRQTTTDTGSLDWMKGAKAFYIAQEAAERKTRKPSAEESTDIADASARKDAPANEATAEVATPSTTEIEEKQMRKALSGGMQTDTATAKDNDDATADDDSYSYPSDASTDTERVSTPRRVPVSEHVSSPTREIASKHVSSPRHVHASPRRLGIKKYRGKHLYATESPGQETSESPSKRHSSRLDNRSEVDRYGDYASPPQGRKRKTPNPIPDPETVDNRLRAIQISDGRTMYTRPNSKTSATSEYMPVASESKDDMYWRDEGVFNTTWVNLADVAKKKGRLPANLAKRYKKGEDNWVRRLKDPTDKTLNKDGTRKVITEEDELKIIYEEVEPDETWTFETESETEWISLGEEQMAMIRAITVCKSNGKLTTVWQGMFARKGEYCDKITNVDEEWITENVNKDLRDKCKKRQKKGNKKFLKLPSGRSRSNTLPVLAQGSFPVVQFQQGEQQYCMFYAYASALFYVGFKQLAHTIRDNAAKYATSGFDEQLKRIVDLMQKNVSWLQPHKFKREELDPLTNKSHFPTVLVLTGTNGSVSHSVATVGKFLCDANLPEARVISKGVLDWCCSTDADAGEFSFVYAAYRFCENPRTKKPKYKVPPE